MVAKGGQQSKRQRLCMSDNVDVKFKKFQDSGANRAGYLQWAVENTKMAWWHDSAGPTELTLAIQRVAVGATPRNNPGPGSLKHRFKCPPFV